MAPKHKTSLNQTGLWERQPSESMKAFHAFRRYWELGKKRSLAAVTDVLGLERNGEARDRSQDQPAEKQKNRKSGQVGLWSRKYDWKERAHEWDVQAGWYYEQRRALELHSMCRRHRKQIGVAQAAIGQLRDVLARAILNRGSEFETMNMLDLMKLAFRGARLLPMLHRGERAALGVKVIVPKSNDGIRRVPEWRVPENRAREAFVQERPDEAFWSGGGEVEETAEQLDGQIGDESGMKPWDRQGGESARAYSAFCAYRELGPDRSLAEVTRRCLTAKRSASYVLENTQNVSFGRKNKSGQVGVWCRKFFWVERCRRWDAYQLAVYKNRLRTEIEQMAKRHALEARLTLEALLAPITALTKSIERHQYDIARMSISQIFRLFYKVAKVIPTLHKCERKALAVELLNRRADQGPLPHTQKNTNRTA